VTEDEEKGKAIVTALAIYFDCEPDEIRHWAVVCERVENDRLLLSWVWSVQSATWQLKGMLLHMLDRIRRDDTNG
jgi:hypothetical protein